MLLEQNGSGLRAFRLAGPGLVWHVHVVLDQHAILEDRDAGVLNLDRLAVLDRKSVV
jgi:hypothetical protein